MSLPTAPKDISPHPQPGSVVDPINREAKDADVDRKLRLYGVIQAFRNGKLPSNAQIDSTLEYVLDHSPIDTSKLSTEGRKLVDDVREIISTARTIVLEKNADEMIQDFIWRTREVDIEGIKQSSGELSDKVPVSQEKAVQDKDQAIKHLRTILSLILTNSEVRKLLNDFSLIGRDLLAIGATKAASTIAPPKEHLEKVDHTAPNDQFITEGGRVAGPGETPVLEAQIPGTDRKVRHHPHEDDAHIVNPDGSRKPVGEAYTEAQAAKEEMKQKAVDQGPQIGQEKLGEAKETAKEEADRHRRDVEEADDPDAEVEEKKQGVMARMRQVRDNLNDRIPQKHKDTARGHIDRGREFLTEEYFPEERRDQFIFRMKKVVVECQKHQDYQQSMTWLLDFLKEYAEHSRKTANIGTSHSKKAAETSNLSYAIAELRTILERFANGQSMDIIMDAINALIDDANRDSALREWFSAVDLFIRKVMLEPGYVLEPDCNNHGNRLRELGREFYDNKYEDHFDNLFNSVGTWGKGMGDDPLNQQFGEDWARLTKDLLFDSEGSLKFKPELWNDIRKVILPTLIDKIGYIPIPRVEYSDDSLDLVVENLTLSGRNLLPNIVELSANNFVKFSPYDAIPDESHHRVKIGLEQIQADMRDVAFYYKKKTGLPKMKDSGIADVIIGGRGLNAHIELSSAPAHDTSSVFSVSQISVKVDTLKFSVRDSSHDFLYKTLRPLATGLIKKQVERAVTDALRTGLEYLDGQLVGVRDRMKNAEGGKVGAVKELFVKSQEKKDEAASIARSTTSSSFNTKSKGQFKIVSDKRNSIVNVADKGHPAGWVNKVEQQKQLAGSDSHANAGQGGVSPEKEWRSDAFHIIDGPNASAGVKKDGSSVPTKNNTQNAQAAPPPTARV